MSDQESFGEANEFIATRTTPGGLVLAVVPLLYGRARLTVGRDFESYDRGY